ncbi:hypothetical protein [Halogeometricum borinquense]|nr:hypothetical protein [Halogeometricum borinquense]
MNRIAVFLDRGRFDGRASPVASEWRSTLAGFEGVHVAAMAR